MGLGIGGEAPPDEQHLARLDALIRRYEPAVFSEHLAWSSHGGVFYKDLLSLPYHCASLDRVRAHIDRVQERLRRRLLLENPSTYLAFSASTMDEAAFLGEVVRRTGCTAARATRHEPRRLRRGLARPVAAMPCRHPQLRWRWRWRWR